MVLALFLVATAILLAINAFFVAAEFAIVRVRSSRVEELKEAGDPRAPLLARIVGRLDEYIGVCQVGITVASVALGMVAERIKMGLTADHDPSGWFAVTVAVGCIALVSGLHIVLGEQVPKTVAIRLADRAALWSARPLAIFRLGILPALWLLNRCTALVMRLLRQPRIPAHDSHSEDELRIILNQSQERGVMTFRRLLFMENIFELGELRVRDAMRHRTGVKCLDPGLPWNEVLRLMREHRFSRFPLLDPARPERPMGVLHVKDLLLKTELPPADLRSLARPFLTVAETATLESVLSEMQRKRMQVALVQNEAGAWTGFLSMEDILEEIIGTITDEFEIDPPIHLAEVASPGRMVLGVEAPTLVAALRQALARIPDSDLPHERELVVKAVLERERLAGTYLGKGVALPHARIPGLVRPALVLIGSRLGIPVENSSERAHILFLLLTPAGQPRVHQRLQARIAAIIENSEYVVDRLREAATQAEAYEVLRTGEQASID